MFGSTFNKSKWHLVALFIMAVLPGLSANAKELINSKKVNPRDSTLVVRNIAVAGGTIDLLEGYSAKVPGKNDFNGNKLTNGRLFIIDSLTLNYGVGVTATVNQNYFAVNYTTALPAALKAANLVIRQGDDVIRRISIAAINEAKSTDSRNFELQGFALLQEDIPTSIEIEFPAGSDLAPGTDNSGYVEVILNGFETAIKR
jgi:hypothetical protein